MATNKIPQQPETGQSRTLRENKPAGTPSKYREEYAQQVYNYCLLGAIDRELTNFFGVSEQTINNWKSAHPEFFESLKRGKLFADAKVADTLYKLAIGYEQPAVKISSNPAGEEHITEYTERFPPDTTACIFWLKNRRPDLWRHQ